MNISTLILRNVTHRKGRFIFTLSGIFLGIASLVTFLALGGSLKNEIERESTALGANLVVTPKGSCAYEQVSILTGEQLPTTITAEEVETLRAIEGMTVLPFFTAKTAIQNRPVPVTGIVAEVTRAHKGWTMERGEYFAAPDDKTVVVGSALADQFGLQPGGEVTVRGERLLVRGVLKETGNRDDLSLFLTLPTAQTLFNVGGNVSYVAVRLDDLARMDEYAQRIRDAVNLGVVTDKQMLTSVLSIVGTVNVTLQLIAAVAVLASAFGIINTMMTAAYERKREIGILQALGAGQRTIFSLFLLESGLYGLFGGVLGLAGGLLLSAFVAPLVSQNAFTSFVKGSDAVLMPDMTTALGVILFSVAISLASGLYPAWRASRLSPVEAISHA
ncbi:MacB-like periplasmic core domain containing protein [Alkalidesulfovibrio alkalitolerans DSM 16529]|uniref:MacB-like periplasmic core domain containing protein n=1 Tax=Alkalidesulfovibrio alkalitolerans DSM 16529 TaxID=1121439 RepID=S7UL36_9BACT|nr:ABC transporter permease [Alkalidesulfovibrio alkalitolerans]EPR33043.1 MacB-like periplasmic core domain containing protein [Alkalidesulfovibrio alkalitolerans DSM 16529]